MANEVKKELVVDHVLHDSVTGHITVVVYWRHTQGSSIWTGPVKGYAVDPDVFEKRFNGDEQQLLNWVASEHQRHKGANPELTKRLMALKGKVIG